MHSTSSYGDGQNLYKRVQAAACRAAAAAGDQVVEPFAPARDEQGTRGCGVVLDRGGCVVSAVRDSVVHRQPSGGSLRRAMGSVDPGRRCVLDRRRGATVSGLD